MKHLKGGTLKIALLLAALSTAAQTTYEPPRTPWGAPDLNGVWNYSVATPLERPDEFADKTHFSEEEAAAYLAAADDRLEGLVSRRSTAQA